MIPFNSHLYLNGRKAFTYYGNEVTGVTQYQKDNGDICYTGMIKLMDGSQMVNIFSPEELFHKDDEMYVRLYKYPDGKIIPSPVYESLALAIDGDICDRPVDFLGIYKLTKV